MIKITSIINTIPNFNHAKYAEHQRREHLLENKYYQNKDGKWFNDLGQFVGDDERQACTNESLTYPILNPIDYYVITEKEVVSLIKKKELVYYINGVRVWVANIRNEL